MLQNHSSGPPQKWVNLNPTHSGWIVVVDQQALNLLVQFRTPVTVPEIIARVSDCSLASIESAVTRFLHLAFLRDIHQPLIPQQRNHLETLSAWLHVTNACN